MELNHLRYFYEVAKAGSFTEAARKLRISQSALSKAVALLEDAEGTKLFERSKKGVQLTSVGQEVFRMSGDVFRTVTEIENTCRGAKETCEGLLRFGASDHVTNYLLTERILKMRRDHPQVIPSVFSGTPNDIIEQILRDNLEFGLFITKINVAGIHYESIAPIDMAVVCHPDLVRDAKSSAGYLRTALKISGYIGSIKSQYQRYPSQEFIDLLEDTAGTIFESSSQETQKRLCLAGGGVAFLARFMVEREIKDGELIEIKMAKPLTSKLLLAKKKSASLSLNARTFLESLPSVVR